MAVDVSWLRPGGEAGGVKPFIFEYLRGLADLEGDRLVLIFLTWSSSHAEVRRLARPQDELVCVRHTESDSLLDLVNGRPGEEFLPSPPPNLLLRLAADLQYIPVGTPQFACPGIPNISTIVDILHRDFPSTLTPQMNEQREITFDFLIKISDRFQCISHYTALRLHEHFAVPLALTFCSYIPIHHRLGCASAKDQTPLLATPYFFYPANAWKHKNHELLLNAYRDYRADSPAKAWDLVLTGYDDERMRQILELVADLDLKGQVHFFGHLPDHEFARVWRHAGALVFPSRYEGFGIPLLEAMHFGIPILSGLDGALAEVAGNAALFADARDPAAWTGAMKRIASDAPLRNDLILRGRQRLSEFSLADEVAEFRDVIVNVASQRSRRHWQKGIHADGWMEKMAIVSLPDSDGPWRISLRIGPNPAARNFKIYADLAVIGNFAVPAWVESNISVEVAAGHRSLVLEVPDAENFDPGDHRQHGVIVDTVTATESSGQTHGLFEAK